MLRTRILTAVVLLPLAFALVFRTTTDQFALILAALFMVGIWEFRKLASLSRGVSGWILMIFQALLLTALWFGREATVAHAVAFLTAACLVWLLMFMRLALFRPGEPADFQYRIVSFGCALATLSFAWIALYGIFSKEAGSWWILLLFLIIWSADTGAYFTGRALGKRKLAVNISPGKTIEGLIGGLITAAVVAVVAVHFIADISAPVTHTVVLALITALVSAAGDLFISLHKRVTGHKDSGRIFPGHGGLLDRTDSLLAGAPFFAMGLLVLGL